MKRYSTPELNVGTSRGAKTRLLTALRAVPGVERATLYPVTGQFEIAPKDSQHPKREDIESAASGAGFALSSS